MRHSHNQCRLFVTEGDGQPTPPKATIPSTSAAVSSEICLMARRRVSYFASSAPAISARASMRSRRCVSGISDKSTRKTALQRHREEAEARVDKRACAWLVRVRRKMAAEETAIDGGFVIVQQRRIVPRIRPEKERRFPGTVLQRHGTPDKLYLIQNESLYFTWRRGTDDAHRKNNRVRPSVRQASSAPICATEGYAGGFLGQKLGDFGPVLHRLTRNPALSGHSFRVLARDLKPGVLCLAAVHQSPTAQRRPHQARGLRRQRARYRPAPSLRARGP